MIVGSAELLQGFSRYVADGDLIASDGDDRFRRFDYDNGYSVGVFSNGDHFICQVYARQPDGTLGIDGEFQRTPRPLEEAVVLMQEVAARESHANAGVPLLEDDSFRPPVRVRRTAILPVAQPQL